MVAASYSTARKAVLSIFLLASLATTSAAAEKMLRLQPDEAVAFANQAYAYGYPLVTMEMTRRVSTNVAAPEGARAPMGQFANLREYPPPSMHTVTAPNADTLDSAAWLDLAKEPYVLSIPDEGNRYYLMPMLDAWTNVFQVPGTRTTGDKAQTYAITGPGWRGTLPAGVTEYESPTNLVWILGRTYCTGTPEDYAAVHKIQDQYKLVPLSAYGKPYTPPHGKVDPSIDMKTAVREQVNAMDASTYFNLMAALMKDNPPAPADAPMVRRLERVGIVPGQPFDLGKLEPVVAKAMQAAPKTGFEQIMAHFDQAGEKINGWIFTTHAGLYGTEYLQRATITAIGLGANRPQDAVYPTAEQDGEGKPLDGASKRYTMHFPKGELPPAKAFWSLTMYNSDYFFVPNSLNRYTLSSRDTFQTNPDGSVDLYFQAESPGKEREANWLPAPKAPFIVMLRLYWPTEKPPSILDGTWKPPALTPIP